MYYDLDDLIEQGFRDAGIPEDNRVKPYVPDNHQSDPVMGIASMPDMIIPHETECDSQVATIVEPEQIIEEVVPIAPIATELTEDIKIPVSTGKIQCVLFITPDGVVEDYLPSSIDYVKSKLTGRENDAIRLYNDKPAYMVTADNSLHNMAPLISPRPEDIRTTSPRLYGMAVVLPKEVVELERLDDEENNKHGDMSRLTGYVLAFVVIVLALIMMIAIIFGNSDGGSSSSNVQSNTHVPTPDFSTPTPSAAAQPIQAGGK